MACLVVNRRATGCAHLPRSARWRDGEDLAARCHEVVRVAGVLDLGQACVQRGAQHSRRVVRRQLGPCSQPGLIVIGCLVGELDAYDVVRD